MTTTPPPEGTTEPRDTVESMAGVLGTDWTGGRSSVDFVRAQREPSPLAPAAEDDAVAAWQARAEQIIDERTAERDEARQQVAALRARIERVEALTEGLLTAEAWNPPEVDTVRLIQKRYRALLAGSGDVENPAPSVATSEGRDKAVATSGEQPDACGHDFNALVDVDEEGHAVCSECEPSLSDRPAPAAPDSTGLRDGLPFYIEDGAARVLVFKSGGRRPATVSEVAMWDLLAVVGQGMTAEQRDEAIRAAAREVAKQARSWPGDGLLHDVPPVEAADAAVRAALESLGIAVVRSGEQGGEA